jgi:ribose/xylose/arabinose/galactoside ABC-type transport system permease subunit
VLVALGVAALLSGTELGPWCLALGALLVAAGLAGLAAER